MRSYSCGFDSRLRHHTPVAQVVRAGVLYAPGCRFESCREHINPALFASIARSGESNRLIRGRSQVRILLEALDMGARRPMSLMPAWRNLADAPRSDRGPCEFESRRRYPRSRSSIGQSTSLLSRSMRVQLAPGALVLHLEAQGRSPIEAKQYGARRSGAMVDAALLKSAGSMAMRVQVPPPAPTHLQHGVAWKQ